MAKKKVAGHRNVQKDIADSSDAVASTAAMDPTSLSVQKKPPPAVPDSSEKVASLKTLNNFLIRQTVDLRQQVDSLNSSKKSLESDLAHFSGLMRSFQLEGSHFQDQAIRSELEGTVERTFLSLMLQEMVATAAKEKAEMTQKLYLSEAEKERFDEEMKNRLALLEAQMEKIRVEKRERESQVRELLKEKEWILREMGGIEKNFVQQKEEAEQLRLMVNELEKRNAEAGEDISWARMECERLMEEKVDKEKKLDFVTEEKVKAERRFNELLDKFNSLIIEKNVTEEQKGEQDLEIKELKKGVAKFVDELRSERDALELLRRERDNFKGVIEDLMKNVKRLDREKEGVEKVKANQELKIIELEEKMAGLSFTISSYEHQLHEEETNHKKELFRVVFERDANQENLSSLKLQEEALRMEFLKLQNSNTKDKEVLGRLLMEFNILREEKCEIERTLQILADEKNLAEKRLEDSLKKSEDLLRKIEKNVDEKEELEKLRIEKEGKISELQKKCDSQAETNYLLEAEIISLKNAYELVLAEKESVREELGTHKEKAEQSQESLQKKMKESEKIFEQVLRMLKNTAEAMGRIEDEGKDAEEGAVEAGKVEKEMRPFMLELEVVNRAFKARDNEVGKLTQELKSLRVCIETVKRRNLWTWLSSATVFAAASVAYITKSH